MAQINLGVATYSPGETTYLNSRTLGDYSIPLDVLSANFMLDRICRHIVKSFWSTRIETEEFDVELEVGGTKRIKARKEIYVPFSWLQHPPIFVIPVAETELQVESELRPGIDAATARVFSVKHQILTEFGKMICKRKVEADKTSFELEFGPIIRAYGLDLSQFKLENFNWFGEMPSLTSICYALNPVLLSVDSLEQLRKNLNKIN